LWLVPSGKNQHVVPTREPDATLSKDLLVRAGGLGRVVAPPDERHGVDRVEQPLEAGIFQRVSFATGEIAQGADVINQDGIDERVHPHVNSASGRRLAPRAERAGGCSEVHDTRSSIHPGDDIGALRDLAGRERAPSEDPGPQVLLDSVRRRALRPAARRPTKAAGSNEEVFDKVASALWVGTTC